jgi:hypothetical protein
MPARRSMVVLFASLALAACAGGSKGGSRSRTSRAGLGVIVGTVSLAPGESLPEYPGADASLRTLMPAPARELPATCPQAGAALRPVTITADGLLAGVLIAASEFTGGGEHEPRMLDVAIRNCRLEPALIDASRGDRLRVTNRDAFEFSPSFGPAREEHPLVRDKPVVIPLGAAGVESIRCPLSAPCGRTDVVTLNHPAHARTDARGHYRIEGFPIGQRVRLSAWHPLFEEASTQVWLEDGEVRRVDLQLVPRKP